MDVLLQQAVSRQTIEAYGNGGFTVSGVRFEGAVLVSLHSCVTVPMTSWDALCADRLLALIEPLTDIEILLIGSGTQIATLSAELRSALRTRGIAADVLDTGAACRTFNVLASEERRVAALLLAV